MNDVRRIGRFYGIAGCIVILFIAFNMVVENFVYVRSRNVYEQNMSSVQTMSEISNKLSKINERVMLMVANMSGSDELEQITVDFGEINALRGEYLALEGHSDMEQRRFNQAYYSIMAYQRKINEVGPTLPNSGFENAHAVFTQELDPLLQSASEMLQATVEISTANANANVHSASLQHGFAQMTLIILTIGGVIALFLAGRAQINSVLEVQLKEEELEEASDRLVASRQKLIDSAKLNILTGLPNRYSLEERLGKILGTKQFYIAVFDIDSFRMVNDNYGYEYGDEYLVAVADRLKASYSDKGELFNIYGNEFCMIFKDDINDMQVKVLAEQIRQNIGSNTQVSGMLLSSPVSSAFYHVLPSESSDVGALLRKLDTALHSAKADGGNRMYYV